MIIQLFLVTFENFPSKLAPNDPKVSKKQMKYTINFKSGFQKCQGTVIIASFFSRTKKIRNFPQINYASLSPLLGRYKCDSQKISIFHLILGIIFCHLGLNLRINFQKWLQKVPSNGENWINFFVELKVIEISPKSIIDTLPYS